MSPQSSKVNTDGLSYEVVLNRIEDGVVDGMCPAGLIQDYGGGVSKKPDEALRLCFLAAEEGNSHAQALVGYCFLFEIGVKRNGSRAFYWYNLSAEQGYAVAKYDLGCMFSAGVWTHRSYRHATQWLLLAAEQNHPEALESLVRFYDMGRGVKKNKDLAFSFLKRAAATKLASAQYRLGVAYIYGSYGEVNVECGIKLLESAVDGGIVKAKRVLEALEKFFIVDLHILMYSELPEGCQIPLRHKTIMLLAQVGLPLYEKMADDVKNFIKIHPEAGFCFFEDVVRLEECAAREWYEEKEESL